MKKWIVLIDSRVAKIFYQEKTLKNLSEIKNKSQDLRNSKIYSDKFGKSKTSYNSRLNSITESRFKDEALNIYAQEVYNFIKESFQNQLLDDLEIYSTPKMMSYLKNKFSNLNKLSISYNEKNLQHLKRQDLNKYFTEKRIRSNSLRI